ncbi:MAG: GGDEF domain-containing protein [Bdellovibrionales bacterium]|jgi:diguanylate cyclase (GGDEF)-like protein
MHLTEVTNPQDLSHDQLLALYQQTSKELARYRALAVKDQLTGLYNRHGMEEEFTHVVSANNRTGIPHYIGVALLDIDYFKKVNDTHGHDIGDRVLEHVASIIQHVARKDEPSFRWGGEEMGVLLKIQADSKKTSWDILEDLRHFGERLREKIENTPYHNSQTNKTIPITVSVGLSVIPASEATTFEALVKPADKLMYRVKETGRNGVGYDLNALDCPSESLFFIRRNRPSGFAPTA